MTDKEFYQKVLGLEEPWRVEEVKLDMAQKSVELRVGYQGGWVWEVEGMKVSVVYDHAPERRWRHLDTCQLETILVAKVPRVKLEDGRVVTVLRAHQTPLLKVFFIMKVGIRRRRGKICNSCFSSPCTSSPRCSRASRKSSLFICSKVCSKTTPRNRRCRRCRPCRRGRSSAGGGRLSPGGTARQ